MKSLYTIIFKDNTTYKGGDYSNTGWLDIPNKSFKRVIYRLPNNDNLVLNGYTCYFHCTEGITDINIKSKQPTKLKFTYIMGKKNGIIICYKINIETDDSGIYDISFKTVDGDEYVFGLEQLDYDMGSDLFDVRRHYTKNNINILYDDEQ